MSANFSLVQTGDQMTWIMIAQQLITLQLKQPHHCVHAYNLPSSFSELAQCGCLRKSLMLAELIQTSQGSGAFVWTSLLDSLSCYLYCSFFLPLHPKSQFSSHTYFNCNHQALSWHEHSPFKQLFMTLRNSFSVAPRHLHP